MHHIQATPILDMEMVRNVELEIKKCEQIVCETWHVLHGGIYSRTVVLEKGVTIVGSSILVPTTLTISGHLAVSTGGNTVEFDGVHIVPASKDRKQVMHAIQKTSLTMSFATEAETIEEAENEFTDESDFLMSREEVSINHINITGE